MKLMHRAIPASDGGNRRFARHYVEMVIVMVAGMAVLYLPIAAAVEWTTPGSGALEDEDPALALLAMALSMTAPMIAWMRFRGHRRRLTNEMAASMLVPTAGVLGLLASGLVEGFDALMAIEHVVMLPSMLAVMLLRRQEYSAPHQAHRKA